MSLPSEVRDRPKSFSVVGLNIRGGNAVKPGDSGLYGLFVELLLVLGAVVGFEGVVYVVDIAVEPLDSRLCSHAAPARLERPEMSPLPTWLGRPKPKADPGPGDETGTGDVVERCAGSWPDKTDVLPPPMRYGAVSPKASSSAPISSSSASWKRSLRGVVPPEGPRLVALLVEARRLSPGPEMSVAP